MASFLATGLVLSGYLLARQPEKYDSRRSKIGILYATPLPPAPLLVVLASRTGWLASLLSIALVALLISIRFTSELYALASCHSSWDLCRFYRYVWPRNLWFCRE